MIFVLSITLAFSYTFLFKDEFSNVAHHTWRTLIYWQNFTLLSEVGYFDSEAIRKPLLHFWSLSVEEHFYVLWPILVYVSLTHFESQKKALFYILVSTISISFFTFILFVNLDPPSAFYHSLARFWEMGLGGLIALSEKPCKRGKAAYYEVIALFLLTTLPQEYLPVQLAQPLSVILTADIIRRANLDCSSSTILYVGRISYSLYLWHWVAISFAVVVFGVSKNEYSLILLSILISFLLATFTYHYIEELRYRRHTTTGSIIAFLIILFLSFYFDINSSEIHRPIDEISSNLAIQEKRTEAVDNECDEMHPDRKFDYCKIYDGDHNKTLVVIGDSHAHAAFPGLAYFGKKNEYNVLLFANSSCPPLLGFKWSNYRVSESQCQEKIPQIIKKTSEVNNLAKLVLISRGPVYIHGEIERPHSADTIEAALETYLDREIYNYSSYAEGILNTFSRITSISDDEKFFLLENPELDFQPEDAVPRLFIENRIRTVSKKLYDQRMYEYRDIVERTSQSNFKVLDSANVFCREEKCRYYDGNFLYADDDHVSVYGSFYQAEFFKDILFK